MIGRCSFPVSPAKHWGNAEAGQGASMNVAALPLPPAPSPGRATGLARFLSQVLQKTGRNRNFGAYDSVPETRASDSPCCQGSLGNSSRLSKTKI
jgi:hypothetical protein